MSCRICHNAFGSQSSQNWSSDYRSKIASVCEEYFFPEIFDFDAENWSSGDQFLPFCSQCTDFIKKIIGWQELIENTKRTIEESMWNFTEASLKRRHEDENGNNSSCSSGDLGNTVPAMENENCSTENSISSKNVVSSQRSFGEDSNNLSQLVKTAGPSPSSSTRKRKKISDLEKARRLVEEGGCPEEYAARVFKVKCSTLSAYITQNSPRSNSETNNRARPKSARLDTSQSSQNHQTSSESESDSDDLLCKTCNKQFLSESRLHHHQRQHDMQNPSENQELYDRINEKITKVFCSARKWNRKK